MLKDMNPHGKQAGFPDRGMDESLPSLNAISKSYVCKSLRAATAQLHRCTGKLIKVRWPAWWLTAVGLEPALQEDSTQLTDDTQSLTSLTGCKYSMRAKQNS